MTILIAFLAIGQSVRLAPDPSFQESLGVSVHADQLQAGGLTKVAELGLGWIRTDLFWERVEKKKGSFDFEESDKWVAECERLGLRALFILDYWHHAYDGPSMRTDVAVNGFARFAREAAARYKGRPVAWEIWNEPNIPQFWKPKPDAAEYLKVALAAYSAIREVAPDATIVAPGLAGMDLTYLRSLLSSTELTANLTGVSFHPYREGAPESVLPEVGGLRSLINAVAPGRSLALVNSEWGYSTANRNIPEARQAEYAARMALTGLAAGFSLSVWYDLRDDGDDEKEREHRFGLFDRRWQPRKAADYLRTLAHELKGFRYAKRLAVGDTTEYCLLFQGEGEPKLVAWTTRDRPTQVALPMGGTEAKVQPLNAASQTKRPRNGTLSVTLDQTPIVLAPGDNDPLLTAALAAPSLPSEVEALSVDDIVQLLRDWDIARKPISRLERMDGSKPRLLLENVAAGSARARLSDKAGELRKLLDQGVPFRLRIVGREGGSDFAQETWVRPVAPFRARWRISRDGRAFLGLTDLAKVERIGTLRADVDGRPRDFAVSADGFEAWSAPDPNSVRPMDVTVTRQNGSILDRASANVVRYDQTPGDPFDYKGTVDAIQGPGGTATLTVGDAPPGLRSGARSLRIEYDIKPGHAYLEVRPPDADRSLKGRPDLLSFWMHGDGSGHAYRARFYDATGQFFQPDLGRIDWVGWRYIEIRLDQTAAGRWGGANDGIVHYPIGLRAVLLIEPGPEGGKGTVALTDILVQGRG
ncbi:MAG: cellulase family glycosylhydrolase [Fimbriimonadaceae bacterium]|nr:cellulase family glycosylhydrolase [Fimbriimonadaceae bacterium]